MAPPSKNAASFGRERLTDKELDRLCFGCVIYAHLRKDGRPVKEPHYGIILNTDEQIQKIKSHRNPTYSVVAVSSNESIGNSEFLMDVPARTGLTGKIQGEWQTDVEEAGILAILKFKPSTPEMIQVLELIRKANAAKQERKSTES